MITWPYPAIEMSVWMPLLGSGIGIAFPKGSTLKGVLCNQLMVTTDYLEDRIQTILVNSQPIDDPEQVCLVHGDIVALSAAMPGLVGTTLRRGSHLAEMRKDITLNTETKTADGRKTSILTLKLFNMVATELGTGILTGRIYIKLKDMTELYRHYPTLPRTNGRTSPGEWVEIDLPDID